MGALKSISRKPMAYIKQIEENQAQGPLKQIYDAAGGRTGSVAKIIKVMSLDVSVVQGSMQFYLNMMKRENALSPSRREMLASVVSNINDCYY